MTQRVSSLSAAALRSAWWQWSYVAVGLVLAALGYFARGRAVRVGDSRHMAFTYIPSDQQNLSCKEGNADFGCGAGPDARVVPGVSTHGQLYLLRGVFGQSTVKRAVEEHRAGNRRFEILCEFRFEQLVSNVSVRFKRKQAYESKGPLWIVVPSDCESRH